MIVTYLGGISVFVFLILNSVDNSKEKNLKINNICAH